MCEKKFPALICMSIAAQFLGNNKIALFSFEKSKSGISVSRGKHYSLVKPEELTKEDLENYKS